MILVSLFFFNSYYPSQHFNNLFTFNFNKKLSFDQRQEWLQLLIKLYQRELIDPFLYAPFLGYSMMNNDCDSINKFFNYLKPSDKKESTVLLFKGICGMNNEKDIESSVKLIKKSIELKVERYFPMIINPIKQKILDYEKNIGKG